MQGGPEKNENEFLELLQEAFHKTITQDQQDLETARLLEQIGSLEGKFESLEQIIEPYFKRRLEEGSSSNPQALQNQSPFAEWEDVLNEAANEALQGGTASNSQMGWTDTLKNFAGTLFGNEPLAGNFGHVLKAQLTVMKDFNPDDLTKADEEFLAYLNGAPLQEGSTLDKMQRAMIKTLHGTSDEETDRLQQRMLQDEGTKALMQAMKPLMQTLADKSQNELKQLAMRSQDILQRLPEEKRVAIEKAKQAAFDSLTAAEQKAIETAPFTQEGQIACEKFQKTMDEILKKEHQAKVDAYSPEKRAVRDTIVTALKEMFVEKDWSDLGTGPTEKGKAAFKKIIVIASKVLRTQEEWDLFKELNVDEQAWFELSIEDEEKHLGLSFEASSPCCAAVPKEITQPDTISRDERKANLKAKLKAKLDAKSKKITDDTLLDATNPCFTPHADLNRAEKSGRSSPKGKEPASPPSSPRLK